MGKLIVIIGGLIVGCICLVMVASSFLWFRGWGPYSLTVTNMTGEPLCSLKIKTASSQSIFIGDELRRNQTLEHGEQFTITGLEKGYYDIWADSCTIPDTAYGDLSIPVQTENATVTLTGSG